LQNVNDFFQPQMLAAMQNYYIQLGQQQQQHHGLQTVSGGGGGGGGSGPSSQPSSAAVQSAAAAILQAAAAKNAAASMGSAFGLSPTVTSASTFLGLANLMAATTKQQQQQQRHSSSTKTMMNDELLPAPKALLGSPATPLSLTPQPNASSLGIPLNRPQTVTPSPGGGGGGSAFRRSPMLISQLVNINNPLCVSSSDSCPFRPPPNHPLSCLPLASLANSPTLPTPTTTTTSVIIVF
jgi:hypothetical protein